jgi:[ribosomal protein S5]-alanine N-acetyltransferase
MSRVRVVPRPALDAFSAFPTLTTERLVLREMTAGDAEDLFAFLGDPEVQRYESSLDLLADVAQASRQIEEIARRYRSRQAITWGVTLRGEDRVIGAFALYFWEQRMYTGDLGYTLARPYWRQGIATEAGRAIVKFGFEEMRVHRLNADARTDNSASVRLLARLGFTHEGVRRECVLNADGTWENWGVFGVLESEYGSAVGGVL